MSSNQGLSPSRPKPEDRHSDDEPAADCEPHSEPASPAPGLQSGTMIHRLGDNAQASTAARARAQPLSATEEDTSSDRPNPEDEANDNQPDVKREPETEPAPSAAAPAADTRKKRLRKLRIAGRKPQSWLFCYDVPDYAAPLTQNGAIYARQSDAAQAARDKLGHIAEDHNMVKVFATHYRFHGQNFRGVALRNAVTAEAAHLDLKVCRVRLFRGCKLWTVSGLDVVDAKAKDPKKRFALKAEGDDNFDDKAKVVLVSTAAGAAAVALRDALYRYNCQYRDHNGKRWLRLDDGTRVFPRMQVPPRQLVMDFVGNLPVVEGEKPPKITLVFLRVTSCWRGAAPVNGGDYRFVKDDPARPSAN